MKKTIRHSKHKITSLLLVLCMCLSIFPQSILAVTDETETVNNTSENSSFDDVLNPIIVEEDVSKRGEFEKHFVCDDGSYIAITYSGAVHEKVNGSWVDIEYDVEENGGDIAPVDDDIKVKFSNNTNSSKLVKLESGGYKISWTVEAETDDCSGINKVKLSKESKASLKNTAQINKENKEKIKEISNYDYKQVNSKKQLAINQLKNFNIKTKNDAESTPVVLETNEIIDIYNQEQIQAAASYAQSIVEYTNAFGDGISLRYILSPGNINEEVVLNSYNGFKSYSMVINTDGLTPVVNVANTVNLIDDDGNVIMMIAAPYMYDSTDAVSKDINVTITQENKKEWRITYTPDNEWLTSLDRVYPVVIDPKVTTESYAQSEIYDAYVYQGQTAYSNSSEPYLYVGYYNDIRHIAYWGIDRLPAIPQDTTITGVGLYMRFANGTSTCEPIGIYATDNTLNTSAINWNNKPAIGQYLDRQAVVPSSLWVNFCSTSMGDIINDAYKYDMQTVSFALKYSYDDHDWDYNMFCSSDHPTTSYRPYLSVKYTNQFYNMPEGKYYIRNANSGLYLSVRGDNITTGSKLTQYKKYGIAGQIWEVKKVGNDSYRITPKNAPNMTIYFPLSSNTVQPDIRNAANNDICGQWRFERHSSNQFIISSVYSPWTALDVDNYSMQEDANIYAYAYHGNANQRWMLEPVSEQSINVNSEVSGRIPALGSLWYSFTCTQTEYYEFNSNSFGDIVVDVYYMKDDELNIQDDEFTLLRNISKNNISLELQQGKTYYIRVVNYDLYSDVDFTLGFIQSFPYADEEGFFEILDELYECAIDFCDEQDDAVVIDPVKITFEYIRRLEYVDKKYNEIKWFVCAGPINNGFVQYIEENAPYVKDYIDFIQEYKEFRFPDGSVIDIPHMCVIINAFIYDTIVVELSEEYFQCLVGWAGDLRTMIPCVLYETNYSNDFYTVFNEALSQIGAKNSRLSSYDLIADIDAVNLSKRIENSSDIVGVFNSYYSNDESKKRYSEFLFNTTSEWDSYSDGDIYSLAYSMMTDPLVENVLEIYRVIKVNDVYDDTSECLTEISHIQISAVCDAFDKYITDRINEEPNI